MPLRVSGSWFAKLVLTDRFIDSGLVWELKYAGTRSRVSSAGCRAVLVVATLFLAGCSAVPNAPSAVGENYPGTCMPDELSWPTDFLASLAGESSGVTGSVVGLRLEYGDSGWVWRVRSQDSAADAFGDPVDDPSAGRESLLDVRTLETLGTHEVTLSAAEQALDGSSAYQAAQDSGEAYPSPLIIEMVRTMDDAEPVWQITTCDTATNEHFTTTTR